MSQASGLRLYVYIRVTTRPATVEIEFPSIQLAQRYRSSIEKMRTKVLPSSRQKPKVVAVELPPSVTDLETNRSMQAFVLHFKQGEDAAKWADAVCRRVKDHPRQIFIKQYWDRVDELEQRLPSVVPKPSLPDRAGSPPTQAAVPSRPPPPSP
ncbi:hypothetical protein CONLIGDRAFT_647439 [Coniochaeta ligniaria NRRL 30616]|uniref:Uncharacterized protein n=1 Tax=Coniochaeta ligniaria NRRL 30616 TaxID=1408157 RepID=A0A1J7IE60_9PEZI|nr:hypothetical protein CONLIGDRAFT_647439 [Coniochaeta ligniaria NRRL 30616]